MQVVKRNGDYEELNIENIRVQTIDACDGLEGTSYEELELDSQIHFFNGIKTSDIQKSLITAAMNKITIDRPNWTYVAARLTLYDLYHNILIYHGKKKKGRDIYSVISLKNNIDKNRDIYGNNHNDSNWIDKYTDEEIEELNKEIDGKRDLLFDLSGVINLKERYLARRDHPVELPQHLHMCVSMFVMQNETKSKRLQYIKELYDALSTLKYINASPINSNGRLRSGGLISCLVTSMRDDLDSITETWSEVAKGSKLGSGWGVDMSRIRSKGSDIGIVKKGSKGLIPFAKVLDSILIAVDQNGKRPGAATIYCQDWSLDVLDFIDTKKKNGDERSRLQNTYIALAFHDLYMERLLDKGDWTLFSPSDVPELTELYGEDFKKKYIEYEIAFRQNPSRFNKETRSIPAVEIMRSFAHRYLEDGNPFVYFHDTVNKNNPHKELGVIRSSNLCFTGDTLVKTPKGNISIDDLFKQYASKTDNVKEGEKFVVHAAILNTTTGKNGIVKKEWKDVTSPAIIFKTGRCRVIEITLNNGGKFKCTRNHLLAKANGGYVEAINSLGVSLKSDKPELDIQVLKIDELKEIFNVYDLNVPATSNFYIDVNMTGILVHNCVIGKTNILTKEYGNTPIGDLVDNGIEEVNCWNGEEWSKTKIFMTSENQHVLKVRLSNGVEIEATEYHKWYIKDSSYKRSVNDTLKEVETKDLKPGDIIPYPKTLPSGYYASVGAPCALKVAEVIDEHKVVPVYCGNEPKLHKLMFNGVLTGQCTEILMPTDYDKTAVCNLGSINLARCNTNDELDKIARLALRAMDNCIDLTAYPTKESEVWQKKLRSTGLGTLGLAEYLANKRIEYGSKEHKDELHRIYSRLKESLEDETKNLAKEKGDSIVKGIRNTYRMAIAPNSSSGMFAGTTNSHELVYNLLWMESSKVGTYPVTAPHIDLNNINYYKTPYQIDPLLQIEMTSIIQSYIDQAISHNVYIDPNKYENGVPLSKIRDIMVHAWKNGLKTLYYCRSKAKKNGEVKDTKIVCSGCEN